MSDNFLEHLEEMVETSAKDLQELCLGYSMIPQQMSGIRRSMSFVLEEAMKHDAAVNQALNAMRSGNYEDAIKALKNPVFN